MVDFDVVVLGGGAVGLSAARFASTLGAQVACVEQFDFFTDAGSSGGQSRMWRVLHSDLELAQMALATKPLWKELEKDSGMSLIDETGILWFGEENADTTEGQISGAVKVLESLSLPYEPLTAVDIRDKYPFKNIPANYSGVFQADAGVVKVKDVLLSLHSLCTKQKVELISRCVAKQIRSNPDGVTLSCDLWNGYGFEDFEISAKKVILCPGPFVNKATQLLNFGLKMDIWDWTSAYFEVERKDYPMWFLFQAPRGDDPGLYYGFPESEWEQPGRIRVCPAFSTRKIHHPDQRINSADTIDLAFTKEFIRNHCVGANPNPSMISNCLIAMTPDEDPILDYAPTYVPNNQNIILYCGGWGFKYVPMFGQLCAQLALDQTPTVGINRFSISRPNVLDLDSQYRHFINSGLGRITSKKKVLIAGAGIAGLVAGSLLKDAGHEVQIVESSERVGGRIRTIRDPFKDGSHAEVGAMRIPVGHSLINFYLKKFNLETHTFLNADPNDRDYIYTNGNLVRRRDYNQFPSKLGYPVLPNELNETAESLLEKAIRPIIEYINANPEKNWPTVIEKYDSYSVGSFLKCQTLYSDTAIEMLGVLLNEEALFNTSLIEMIRDQLEIGRNNAYVQITAGMDTLTNCFLSSLKPSVQLNARIRKISQIPDGTVQFLTDSQTFSGDRAIVTLPFTSLRFVETEPQFSHRKRKAIRALNYDVSTKIFLQFSERFWEKNDGIKGGCTTTDTALRFVYYPSTDLGSDGAGIVLASYTWSDDSQRWTSLSHELRIEESLKLLTQIHGPEVREKFVTGYSYSWLLDPDSKGAFALFEPGQETELLPYIATPEGVVHFAGEHTSLRHGWIEGAIESGVRAAKEVFDALQTQPRIYAKSAYIVERSPSWRPTTFEEQIPFVPRKL